MRVLKVFFASLIFISAFCLGEINPPQGTYTATQNSSYYVSFGSAGDVFTNVGVFSSATLLGTWVPSASLRRISENQFYFPATVSLPAGNSGIRCTYFGTINVFVVSDYELDLNTRTPAQIYLDAAGHCAFKGQISSTVPFRR